jgi:hypothetical protein
LKKLIFAKVVKLQKALNAGLFSFLIIAEGRVTSFGKVLLAHFTVELINRDLNNISELMH